MQPKWRTISLKTGGMPLVMVFLSHNSPTLWNWVTWVALIILKVSTFEEKEACQYSGGEKNVPCPRSPPHKHQESLSWFWKGSGEKSPACLSATMLALAFVLFGMVGFLGWPAPWPLCICWVPSDTPRYWQRMPTSLKARWSNTYEVFFCLNFFTGLLQIDILWSRGTL